MRTSPGSRWRLRTPPALAAAAVLLAVGPLSVPASPAGAEAAGGSPFWVVLDDQADLSAARSAPDKAAKGRLVYEALTRHATQTQAGLRRLLDQRGIQYQSFWINNSIRVTGDAALSAELRSRPEVQQVVKEATPATTTATATAPGRAPAVPADDAVQWNIARVGADRVWRDSGTRGEGITVASIDSGVAINHPALSANYRGRYSNGASTTDYSFLDLTGACRTNCDEDGHGTHVMGILAGNRTDGPQIGVAPQARWIAASALKPQTRLAAAQWMLAPTDAAGGNPRPDLAPDVVNNSWISDEENFLSDAVDAWIAAGIFPVFAAGNGLGAGAGSICSRVSWPASLENAYAVGNTTPDDTVSTLSSRGPGRTGLTKPDIAAPGTNIVSSWSTWEDYTERSGTSEAAPHVAGAVALLWSAVPELQGDVAATRRLLDATAHDIDDTECGGTPADNNAAGEGRLDIPGLLQAAPHHATGGLTGTVTDSTGKALPDAQLLLSGPKSRTLTTDAKGHAGLDRMVPGTYTYRTMRFGYRDATGTVVVKANQKTTLSVRPEQLPSATVSGVVRSAEGVVADATVSVPGTPALTRTDASGAYRLQLPLGTHDISVTPTSRCAVPVTDTRTLSSDLRADVTLPPLTDEYGYTCTRPASGYQEGATKLDISGSTSSSAEIALPFPISLYGRTYRTAWVSTDGALSMTGPTEPPTKLPTEMPYNFPSYVAIFPFFTTLDVDADAGVYLTSSADRLVVEWRNVVVRHPTAGIPGGRISFSLVVRPDNTFTVNYRDVSPGGLAEGVLALIGIENNDAENYFAFGNLQRVVTSGQGFTIHPPTA